jgi:hypothetical protein
MKHGASREVIRVLESLPDKEYINAADFSRGFDDKKYVSKGLKTKNYRRVRGYKIN